MNFGYYPVSQIGMDDGAANLWLIWHSCSAILEKTQLFFSSMLFAPDGASLKLDFPFFNSLIGLPAYLLGGPALTYNFLLLFGVVVSFWGFYLFVKSATQEKLSAVAGALIFTFSSYRLNTLGLGQLDLLGTQWLGFILYFLYSKKIFWFSLFTALTAYTDPRTFIFTSIFSLTILVYKIIFDKEKAQTLKGAMKWVLGVFLLILPLIFLNRENLLIQPIPLEPDSPKLVSADVLAYFIPFQFLSSKYYGLTIPFLGFLSIIFTAFYAFKKPKLDGRFKSLIFAGIVMFVLSLGSGVNVMGENLFTSALMPYEIMKNIPILSLFRSPVRFSLGVVIPIAVFAALGIKEFVKNKPKPLVFVLYILLILQNFPFSPPITFVKIDYEDRALTKLRSLTTKSVLFVPFGTMDSFDQPHGNFDWEMLTSQTVHQKPIVGGYLSYVEPKTLHSVLDDTFITKLFECQKKNLCQKTEAEAFVNKFNVGYLLIKKDSSKDLVEFSAKSLGGHLEHESDKYYLYKIK